MTTPDTTVDEADKKELRQEIRNWWHAIAEHLDKVVRPSFNSIIIFI